MISLLTSVLVLVIGILRKHAFVKVVYCFPEQIKVINSSRLKSESSVKPVKWFSATANILNALIVTPYSYLTERNCRTSRLPKLYCNMPELQNNHWRSGVVTQSVLDQKRSSANVASNHTALNWTQYVNYKVKVRRKSSKKTFRYRMQG